MKKIILLLILLSATSFLHSQNKLGLIRSNPKNSSFFKEAFIPLKSSIPNSIDHSAYMPPVGNQGSIGSCVGWAVGYYYKTYQEWQDYSWSTYDANHILSASFVYNHINGGMDWGADFDDAFKLLCENGCANIVDMPYTSNYNLWPSEQTYINAMKFRSDSAFYISVNNSSGLAMAKQHIANGNCAVLGIAVYPNFDNIQNFQYTYCNSDVYGGIRGYHAVTIVGYDDSKVTHDGVGAFKLVNSWGNGWGNSGYFWMSYEAVMGNVVSEQVFYYTTDKIHYQPKLYARVKINHPQRLRVKPQFGIGSQASPFYSKSFFNFNMGNNSDVSYPDNFIAFDLSDGYNFINQNSVNNIYLKINNTSVSGVTGTITNFGVKNAVWDLSFNSTEVPLSISGTGNTIIANTQAGPNITSNVGMYSLDINDYSAPGNITPKVTVQNFGSAAQTFPVTLTIGSVYNQTIQVNNLPPGTTSQISFPVWNAVSGSYQFKAITKLSTDLMKQNDTLYKTVNIFPIPNSPMQISPINGVNGLFPDVTINWTRSIYASNYLLQISTDSNFQSGFLYRDSSITDTFKTFSGMTLLTKYYWKVKAINLVGGSNYSPVWNFKTIGLPASVYLLNPINYSGNISVPVMFIWSKSFDQSYKVNSGGKDESFTISQYMLDIVTDTSILANRQVITTTDTVKLVSSLNGNTTYYWRVNAKSQFGWGTFTNWNHFTTAQTSIKQISSEIPKEYKLENNYPNPFNPSTKIKFSLPQNSAVKLSVYDISGKSVAILINDKLNAGYYEFEFEGSNLSSGIYFYKIEAGSFSDVRKMILLK